MCIILTRDFLCNFFEICIKMVDTYKIDDIQVKNNSITDMKNNHVAFKLVRCKILDINDRCIKVKTRSIDTLYPIMYAFEKKHGLRSSFCLEECGVCLNVTTNTSNFKDILNNNRVYNIELRLDVIDDLCTTYRILRITADTFDIDTCDINTCDINTCDIAIDDIDLDDNCDINDIAEEDVAEPDSIDIVEIKGNITLKIKKLKKKYL
jgi:hypothetical protein